MPRSCRPTTHPCASRRGPSRQRGSASAQGGRRCAAGTARRRIARTTAGVVGGMIVSFRCACVCLCAYRVAGGRVVNAHGGQGQGGRWSCCGQEGDAAGCVVSNHVPPRTTKPK
ncbi:hypothetical protein C8R44DRAFT_808222 [Mycena epipterygia]|nr:hypothetical protein C8R44DRAFT_808222 [Mycena epipterygia]